MTNYGGNICKSWSCKIQNFNCFIKFWQILFRKYVGISVIEINCKTKFNKPYNISEDKLIMSRLRNSGIGHSKFTHSYLLKGENSLNALNCYYFFLAGKIYAGKTIVHTINKSYLVNFLFAVMCLPWIVG